MARSSFRQAEIERLIRAAARTNSTLRVDLKTLVVTIVPMEAPPSEERAAISQWAPDGKENWD
ncbi:hypothetical protein [Shinella sp.]|uniref:hypothetical protein n=1 Tax=Shinella sp. TaxID=1870904 RepID=UPI003F72411A